MKIHPKLFEQSCLEKDKQTNQCYQNPNLPSGGQINKEELHSQKNKIKLETAEKFTAIFVKFLMFCLILSNIVILHWEHVVNDSQLQQSLILL